MRAAVVLKSNPVTDDAHRMLDALEAVSMHALLLQGPDEALNHAIIRHDGGGAFGVGSAIVMASGVWGIGST